MSLSIIDLQRICSWYESMSDPSSTDDYTYGQVCDLIEKESIDLDPYERGSIEDLQKLDEGRPSDID